MRRPIAGALAAALLAAATAGAGERRKHDGLLRVVAPVHKETAVAHPHVNVVVLFGATADGVPADPATFRAKLGGAEVTRLFEPYEDEADGSEGMRARLDAPLLRVDAGRNKLRLQVRSVPFARGRRMRTVRDKDKVKFEAASGPDRPPTAQATADSALVLPGIPVRFDGRQSRDPDLDVLDFLWDFGDGATSTAADPTHVYTAGAEADLTVTLTVSDGQLSDAASLRLAVKPGVDPGRTEGLLGLAADGPLEMGVVPVGQGTARTFTVMNLDPTPTSQVKIAVQITGAPFAVEPASLDLGPGESAPVAVTFTPAAAGHAHARLGLAASASGPSSVDLLAHGYGGAGHGTGPTLAATPLFFARFDAARGGLATFGLRADGAEFAVDASVGGCTVPGGGSGSGDACLVNADCSAHGGTCTVCPGPNCDGPQPLEPADLCGDPAGNVFILSEDVTFTDPNPDAPTPRAATLMRVTSTPDGAPIEKRILMRPTEETAVLACDALAAESGRVYLPEFFNVDDDACDRTEKQTLASIRKNAGNRSVLLSRFDSILGLDGCNDLEDTVSALAVSGDGGTVFAHFDDAGIWRVRPAPRGFLTRLPNADLLALHADGAVLYAAATDSGTVGFLDIYKVTAEQVATGPLPLSAVMPCASIPIPNNGGRTVLHSLAAGPSADPMSTAIHVTFSAFGGDAEAVLPPELAIRGTALVTSASGSATCVVVGVTGLEALDLLAH
jgi:PKD repeat protein